MDIEIGDRVMIRADSPYYREEGNQNLGRGGSSNPVNTLGTYINFKNRGKVKWDNGKINNLYGTCSYEKSHLVFISRPVKIKIHELWL